MLETGGSQTPARPTPQLHFRLLCAVAPGLQYGVSAADRRFDFSFGSPPETGRVGPYNAGKYFACPRPAGALVAVSELPLSRSAEKQASSG